VDATAWAIHGQIHQRLPQARAVLHLHPIYHQRRLPGEPQILPVDRALF
jgi:hypothetical protein